MLGNVTAANYTGVRVWVKSGTAVLDDESLTRWRIRRNFDSILAADVSGRLKGSTGTAGYSDAVGIDNYGFLRIAFNRSGIYDREALISYLPAALGSKLFVADLNLDGSQDIIVLQPRGTSRVLLGHGSIADRYVEANTISYGGAAAVIQDLTGDLIPDILMSVSSTPKGLVFFQGRGDGRFTDKSSVYLSKVGPLSSPVVKMALLKGSRAGQHSLVLGFMAAHDQILRATNGIFDAGEELAVRGSSNTTRYLVEDFDLDGDQDLVVARNDTFPALLLGQTTDFCNVGIGQAGRQGLISLTFPDLATIGGIAIGFPSTRVDLGSMGILRLGRMSVVLMLSPSGSLEKKLRLPLPAKMVPAQIPMQFVTAQGGAIRFRNQDNFRPTAR